jgi:NADH:ubiquinone oxidoreductase subunit 2 (subunit N)
LRNENATMRDLGTNPYESPRVITPASTANRLSWRDVWFVVSPAVALGVYGHIFAFMASRGIKSLSPHALEGHPAHESFAVSWLLLAEMLVLAIVWWSSAAWVCARVSKSPTIRYKAAWITGAALLSPIVCPFFYFRVLRPAALGRPNGDGPSSR